MMMVNRYWQKRDLKKKWDLNQVWEWFQAQENCTYVTNNGIADALMLADEVLSDSVKVIKHVELRNHLVWKNALCEF